MKNLLAIAFTLTTVAACGTDQPSDDGLQLDMKAHDRVSGILIRDEIGLTFDFRRDPNVGQHYVVLETENGDHLMTEATAGGYRVLNVLDGRFTSAGPIDGSSEPRTTGDPHAVAELLEMTQMKLLGPLRTALTDRGVDADLQSVSPAEIRSYMWMPGMMRM